MEIKGVFFDMDGTVADTESLWRYIIDSISDRFGLDFTFFDRVEDGYNLAMADALKLILEESGRYSAELEKEILDEVDVLYETALNGKTSLIGGIPELLQTLRDRGIVSVLVSNSTRRQAGMILEHYGLSHLIGFIVAADDVARGKPDREPYCRALELTGLVPEEVVAVEDSDTGEKSAAGAGIACIRVRTNTPFEAYDLVRERLNIR